MGATDGATVGILNILDVGTIVGVNVDFTVGTSAGNVGVKVDVVVGD